MKAKIKLIKKADRNAPPVLVEVEASANPKEWTTAVKGWVKDFKKDRTNESVEAFDGLSSGSTSQTRGSSASKTPPTIEN